MSEPDDPQPPVGSANVALGTVQAGYNATQAFISYASADGPIADSVCHALEGAGVTCWIAPRDVTPGELYSGAIVHAIDSTTVVVLVLSQNATVSQHVLREVERASSKRHPVVSFRIDLAPIPAALEYFLNTSQWLDASITGVERALPKLVDAVQRCIAYASDPATGHSGGAERAAARTDPDASVATQVRQRSRLMLVALAAITAVALAYLLVDHFWLSKRIGEQKSLEETTPTSPTNSPVTAAIPDKSIAVLPFADMSAKKDQEYMSDGIAEELLNLLAQVPDLKVIARTSSFSFKGQNIDVAEIAKKLNVSHVLEGSVRTSGNKLRITAQLVRTADSTHVWSETYDRPLNDIFKIQDEIAGAVVAQLKIALLGAAPKATEVDTEAYALYLRARQMYRQYGSAFDKSIPLYREALAIDTNYAASWSGLADSYSEQAFLGRLPSDEGYRLAGDAYHKALAIDPEYALAHAGLSKIAMHYDNDLSAAALHLEHALMLAPGNTDILMRAMELATVLGRSKTAIALGQYVVAHDPMDPNAHEALAWSYGMSGRLDESIASARAALTLSPHMIEAHYDIGAALLLKGDREGALTEMQAEPEEGWRLTGLAMAYHALGQSAASDAALAELIAKHEKTWASTAARVLAVRGESDRAFALLNKAVAYHDTGVVSFPIHPQLASLHDDPRWLPFLRRIGKAPEQLAAIKFEVKLPE
jgi:adenylate cyclase